MIWRYIIKALLYILLLAPVLVPAAEYRDHELWIEVLLNSGNQISVQPAGDEETEVNLSELASPISLQMEAGFSVSLLNAEKLAFWGLLNRTEAWRENSTGVKREYFAWEDTTLIIRQENLVFEDISFTLLDQAKQYALQTGIPSSQIQSIPLINSTVKITGRDGKTQYFETPLVLRSTKPLMFGGIKLGFSGEFIVKTVNEKMIMTQLLPLEEYVAGVIQNEIGSNAPLEALKTQAVAARTHAISLLLYNRHKNDGYDLCNSTHCQVYKGKYLLNDEILRAVEETSNQVMLSEGRIADATYHSACGGKTDSSENIWNGKPLSHLMGVTCIPECDSLDLSLERIARKWIDTPFSAPGMSSWEKASVNWQKSLSRNTLAKNTGLAYINRIQINKRGYSGRITDMTFFGNKTVRLTNEYKIRQAFSNAPSSFFYLKGGYSINASGSTVIYPGASLTIKGKGSGHGVGMCQVGALRLAREGLGYREILARYYPGILLSSSWRQIEPR
jgi:SpoIID/LytB domain protein